MSTLDQLVLLEQKVEGAVAKIQQLQAENDALRSKCAELTNALSAKSEQLSSFESDKGRIETGIQKALDRLSTIENSMLQPGGSSVSSNFIEQEKAPVTIAQETVPSQPVINQQTTIIQDTPQPVLNVEPVQPTSSFEDYGTTAIVQNFNTMENVEDDEEQQGGDFGFDIF